MKKTKLKQTQKIPDGKGDGVHDMGEEGQLYGDGQ